MIFKYKIHCITEDLDLFWYLPSTDPAPDKCPHDSTHKVDASSVVVVDSGPGATEVVTQYEKNDKDLKLARAVVELDNSNQGIMSVKIPGTFGSADGRYVAGGYAISEDYNKDDFISVFVEDTDRLIAIAIANAMNSAVTTPLPDQLIQQMGVLPAPFNIAFPNYPIVKSYTDDELAPENQGWYFWANALGNALQPNGECEVEPIGGYGFIPSGMHLKLVYTRPQNVTTGGCRVNIYWGKKE